MLTRSPIELTLINMTIKFKRKGLIFTIFFLLVLFTSYKASAAVISPDKYYIDTKESNTINKTLTIYSAPNQNKTVTYNIRVIGVKKIGTGNERSFYSPDPNNKDDVSNWINVIDKQVKVDPGQTVNVNWQLNIPTDYLCQSSLTGLAVSEAEETTEAQGSNISIANEVISQIHISTSKVDNSNCAYYEDLILKEFKTTATLPIFNYDNIEFKTSIENESEYLSRNIKGFIELFGIGKKVTLEFNENSLDIYPKSTRIFNTTWMDPNYPRGNIFQEFIYELTNFRIGPYTARLGVTKNIQKPIIATTTIWIFPWKVILFFLVILIGVIWFAKNSYKTKQEIKYLKKEMKKRN